MSYEKSSINMTKYRKPLRVVYKKPRHHYAQMQRDNYCVYEHGDGTLFYAV